jgi:hydrogenase/urease accessory protein HupE
MKKFFFSLIILLSCANLSIADEIRMGYLELNENKKNSYSVIFKIPIKFNTKLDLKANLPSTCKKVSEVKSQLVDKAYLVSWDIKCEEDIFGKEITIDGLKTTNTDLLLQLKFLNGLSQTIIMSPNKESYIIPKEASSTEVVKTYTFLGVEHILEGFDHLLFVFALLLIAKNIRQLIWTITAFTLAHSITLVGVTFGYLQLPQQPVEAIIALSIIFLAMEVVHQKRGVEGVASRYPWIVSFTFGLLHGFGFAGALAEIGLPQHSIPLALVFFNVGVEIGQLMFVSVIVLFAYMLKKINQPSVVEKGRMMIVYGIGSLASFWFIERVSGF